MRLESDSTKKRCWELLLLLHGARQHGAVSLSLNMGQTQPAHVPTQLSISKKEEKREGMKREREREREICIYTAFELLLLNVGREITWCLEILLLSLHPMLLCVMVMRWIYCWGSFIYFYWTLFCITYNYTQVVNNKFSFSKRDKRRLTWLNFTWTQPLKFIKLFVHIKSPKRRFFFFFGIIKAWRKNNVW